MNGWDGTDVRRPWPRLGADDVGLADAMEALISTVRSECLLLNTVTFPADYAEEAAVHF